MYESDNILSSWDGYFEGELQEMDSYTWVLKYELLDPDVARGPQIETGNVILLR